MTKLRSMDKKGKQSKLVGWIILADFIQYPLEKFIDFIKEVEGLSLYKKLAGESIIIRQPLLDTKIRRKSVHVPSRVGLIAEVKGWDFSIHYTKEELSIEYLIDDEKLQKTMNEIRPTEEEEKNVSRLLNKLRRINTRNIMVHEILKRIVEYQRNYFESKKDNELGVKLKPLQMTELARIISSNKNSYSRGFAIDASRISRVVKGISIIIPQGRVVSLKELLPSKRDIVKRYIKVLLNREREEIYDNRRKMPYTDEELRIKLNDECSLSITRREVAYCRKDLGILPYSKRNGYVYRALLANFSEVYPFTVPSVKNNAPACPGVYEFSLNGEMIEYPKGCCRIFYIGSGKNLRKRLLEHLSSNNKNGGIKRVVGKEKCIFRYLQVPKGWAREEKKLYDLFVTTYGDSPVWNHISPKVRNEEGHIRRSDEGKGAYI